MGACCKATTVDEKAHKPNQVVPEVHSNDPAKSGEVVSPAGQVAKDTKGVEKVPPKVEDKTHDPKTQGSTKNEDRGGAVPVIERDGHANNVEKPTEKKEHNDSRNNEGVTKGESYKDENGSRTTHDPPKDGAKQSTGEENNTVAQHPPKRVTEENNHSSNNEVSEKKGTELRKVESQGTQNLNYMMEHQNPKPRETPLAATRPGWLQINYIAEDDHKSRLPLHQDSLPQSRPKVAKFGTSHDEEIRNEIHDSPIGEGKDAKHKLKSSMEIEVPNHDLAQFFEAAEKLQLLADKNKVDVVLSVSVGRDQKGKITHFKKAVFTFSKPEELSSNTAFDKIKAELGI